MLRVLRLALNEPFQHLGRFVVPPLRDVGLGQAVHRGEDVRLLVQLHVDADEALERRRVAGVDAEDAVQHLHRATALAARERFLRDRIEHLQRFVRVALPQTEIGQRLSDGRLVRVGGDAALERRASAADVAARHHDPRPRGEQPRVVLVRLQRRLDDALRVLVVLRLEQRRDQRLDQLDVARVDLQRLLEDLHRLVEHAALEQHPPHAVVLLERLAGLVVLRVEVGQLDVDVDRVRIEIGDLAVDDQRVSGIAVLEVVVGQDLVLALRLHGQPLLRVEVGQLGVDVQL